MANLLCRKTQIDILCWYQQEIQIIQLFLFIKKKLENKSKSFIYAPISGVDYSRNYFKKVNSKILAIT